MVSRSDRIFLFLLGAGFLLRLSLLDYPIHNPEALRDYLVARHIVHYGEVPLAGPCCLWNSFFGLLRHSPLTYYLLAVLVALRDDILFLLLVNLLLQMAVMVMVYVMVKRLFSPETALLTTLLLMVNGEITKQSLSFWQPYLAQGAAVASFFALFLAWYRRTFNWQLVSMVLYVAAVGFHPSYAGLFPLVSLLHLILVRKEKRLLTKIVVLFVAAAGTASVFFLPLGMTAMPGAAAGILTPPTLYLGKVKEVVDALVKVWFPSGAAVLFVLGVVVYLSRAAFGVRKQLYLLLWLAIAQFLVVASLFQTPTYPHYLTPILLAVAILVAETAVVVPWILRLPRMVAAILILLLVVAASRGGYVLRALATPKIAPSLAKATTVLAQELAGSTFGVVVYPKQAESPVHTDLLLAVPLEKALGKKLLTVDDSKWSYQVPAGTDTVAALCLAGEESCRRALSIEFPNFRAGRVVYKDHRLSALVATRGEEVEIDAIKQTKNLQAQVSQYLSLIKRIGPAAAQEALYHSGLPFDGATHLLNHAVGDYLYETYGPSGLVHCKDYFLSSCHHGFVIRAIGGGAGVSGLTGVMEVCYRQGPTVSIQCAHAIGHGILAWEGYANLLTALSECDRVKERSPAFPLYNCHDGAFMENIWAIHEGGNQPSKDAWLKPNDLLYPCNDPRIPYQYLQACWSNQPMRIYQMSGGEVAEMGRVCLGVSDTVFQATCFDGAARQIHPVARGQVAEVFRLCRLMPEAWQVACVASIVKAEFSVGGRELPFGLCEAIWESGRTTCDRALSEILRAYIANPDERVVFCQRIKTPTEKTSCLQ